MGLKAKKQDSVDRLSSKRHNSSASQCGIQANGGQGTTLKSRKQGTEGKGVVVSLRREEGREGWVLQNGKVQKSTSRLAYLLQAVQLEMAPKLLTESVKKKTVNGDRSRGDSRDKQQPQSDSWREARQPKSRQQR